jgi:hypothetical protein
MTNNLLLEEPDQRVQFCALNRSPQAGLSSEVGQPDFTVVNSIGSSRADSQKTPTTASLMQDLHRGSGALPEKRKPQFRGQQPSS